MQKNRWLVFGMCMLGNQSFPSGMNFLRHSNKDLNMKWKNKRSNKLKNHCAGCCLTFVGTLQMKNRHKICQS
ncbi:Os03g0377500 [Oryza sativa Japonica Group]|uniref:Os03g0377500 protein n=1 Tax=Oryza sativa subsp. japonica TaxID=39947 RepID=C7IZQ4_ORYSJ|nr:Os03g0377500 [Oryza sativa Japonica Group]|eukprot:NP_001173446.1 Os03g0377500 [Oryza sativa Japonica Group]